MAERVRELNTDEQGSQMRWELVRRRQTLGWNGLSCLCAAFGAAVATAVYIGLDYVPDPLRTVLMIVAVVLAGPAFLHTASLSGYLGYRATIVDRDTRALSLCLDESQELHHAMEELRAIGEAAGVPVLRANYSMQEDRTVRRRALYGVDYWLARLLLQEAMQEQSEAE